MALVDWKIENNFTRASVLAGVVFEIHSGKPFNGVRAPAVGIGCSTLGSLSVAGSTDNAQGVTVP